MNTKMKKVLTGFASLLVIVALIAIAPVSRIIYSIYDTNRTNEILAQLEAEATRPKRVKPSTISISRLTCPPLRKPTAEKPLKSPTCWC